VSDKLKELLKRWLEKKESVEKFPPSKVINEKGWYKSF